MMRATPARKWCGTNIRREYAERILQLDHERPWSVTEYVDLAVKEKLEREEGGSRA